MIIVLYGVKGSGKDTVGNLLSPLGFNKESFAKPLKTMVKEAFAFTDEDLYGTSSQREHQYTDYPFSGPCLECGTAELKPHLNGNLQCAGCLAVYPRYVTPRIALQTLGTQWGRRLYTNVWIDAAFSRISSALRQSGPGGRWVITDGRFANELRRCKELGAFAVKLTRGLAGSTDTHASEAEFRSIPDHEFHYVLDNARLSLDDLPSAVSVLINAATKWKRPVISV